MLSWFRRRERFEPPALQHTHGYEEPPANAISWVRRIFQPPPAPAVIEEISYHETDPGYELSVPALNDIFDFAVTVHLNWCVTGQRMGFGAEIDAKRAEVRQRVYEIVRDVARRHPPFRPAEAEHDIQRSLDREFQTAVHECDQVTVQCTPYVEVTLGEEVRRHRQELGRRLLEIEADAEAARLRLAKLTELRDLWLDFLDLRGQEERELDRLDEQRRERADRDRKWRTRFAVRLAENPKGVHEVMAQMDEKRRKDLENLTKTVESLVNKHQAANIYDLVVSSETVLRKTLELMGLPTPDRGESLFDPIGNELP